MQTIARTIGKGRMKNLIKLIALILVLLPFMQTRSSMQNHKYKRYNGAQIEEMILTINHLQKPIY